jgi:hypothetical protein
LASAGARPSQEKTCLRSIASRALRPAVRWIAIRPKLAPAPASAAATHNTTNCAGPEKVASTASRPPPAVSATAMRTGR